jgi:serine acetyltransferase
MNLVISPASAHTGDLETLRENLFYLFRMVHRLDEWSVSHGVWIAMRENDKVACAERKRPVVSLHMGVAATLGQQVKNDHMLRVN